MKRPNFRGATLALFLGLSSPASPADMRDAPPDASTGIPVVAMRFALPEVPTGLSAGAMEAALDGAAEAESGALYPLHWAAIQNQVVVVTRLVQRGMQVDMRDAGGRTPLMAAASFGNEAVADALIALGADMRAGDRRSGDTPLHYAARAGQAEIVRLLLSRGIESDLREGSRGATALHYAAMFGHRTTIELLVTSGVDPDIADNNGLMPQQYASLRRRPEIVDFLRGLGAREDNLHDAVNTNDVARVSGLIADGADVNRQGLDGTPLHLAAAKGHIWILRTLIDAGADLEAEGEPARSHPMHAAAFNGQAEAVRLLIARGAKLEARDDWGKTPLLVAAVLGNLSVAETLLAGGADPFAREDIYGDTSLHLAASGGHVALAKLFLDRGIDVNVRSGHDGEAPLHYAAQWAQLPMIQFLAASGADLNLPDGRGATPLIYASLKKTNLDSSSAAKLLRELGPAHRRLAPRYDRRGNEPKLAARVSGILGGKAAGEGCDRGVGNRHGAEVR